MFIKMHNKRAVSIMIGYILLITFAVVISAVVFQWLKSYVPKQGLECPDGVSLYILESERDGNNLVLTLRNNGKFNIDGIFIYYSTDETHEIATEKIANRLVGNGATAISDTTLKFKSELEPGKNITLTFNFDLKSVYIYAIEITPIREQEHKNKMQTVSCTNAKTKTILDKTFGITSSDDYIGAPK